MLPPLLHEPGYSGATRKLYTSPFTTVLHDYDKPAYKDSRLPILDKGITVFIAVSTITKNTLYLREIK